MKFTSHDQSTFKKPSLSEVLGDLIPIYNLKLYEEMGHNAAKTGKISDAVVWFTQGLSMARSQRDQLAVENFKILILENLERQ